MTPLRPLAPIFCPSYNDYRYGLNDLNPYMAAVGAGTIKARYGARRVTYLIGRDRKIRLAFRSERDFTAHPERVLREAARA